MANRMPISYLLSIAGPGIKFDLPHTAQRAAEVEIGDLSAAPRHFALDWDQERD